MEFFKRFGFLILTNIMIMITINIMLRIFGFDRYVTSYGLNIQALMGFCLIWGMAGSMISLLLSKTMAKMMMGVQEINGRGQFSNIYTSVARLSKAAGISMPEVGIYHSPEINAFATGPSKHSSLVAVSTGLLESMSEDEVEGVLAHEVSHIANGDMVTMTLIQGMVNAFGMFLARIFGFFIASALSSDDEDGKSSPSFWIQFIVTFILDILFTILGSMVVAYFSRMREYKADYGGAKLAGRAKMIAALENLKRTYEPLDDRGASMASLKISGAGGFLALFSTHPPLEDRIKALKSVQIK